MVISLETKQPILSRYQIGSNLFADACITHHSVFEVYGYGSQVFYECFVETDKGFSDFEKIAGLGGSNKMHDAGSGLE